MTQIVEDRKVVQQNGGNDKCNVAVDGGVRNGTGGFKKWMCIGNKAIGG